jgi:ERCC4-type nuclease
MKIPDPTIAIDTREQLPWNFPADVPTERATLSCGDYSVRGFENQIAIERKSLGDLTGTITFGRERFIRELQRFAPFEFGAVVIEANIGDVWAHKYVSKANPASIVGSCAAFTIDFGIPFFFAGDASRAADFALRLLKRFYKNATEKTNSAAPVSP